MPGATDAPDADPRPPQAPRASQAPRARVVLLHRPGATVPPELREALRRNHSEPIEVDHALEAMARLTGAGPAVLLLCEPDKLTGAGELLAAVERYHPRVTRWEYIQGANPPLRPIAGPATPPPASPSPAGPDRVATRAADPFALRLTRPTGTAASGRAASAGDLLTRDEMEALFSEDSP